MKFKAICTDIDGTLLNAERELSPATLDILRRAKERVPLILASSRMPAAMRHLQAELGILGSPLVCYNGGYVIHFPEGATEPVVLHSTPIPLEACKAIHQLAQGTEVHVSLYHADEWYVPAQDQWAAREANNTKVQPTLADFEEVFADWAARGIGAHKVMCMGPADEIEAITQHLAAHFGETLNLYRSKPTYLEIAHRSISKRTALQLLLDHVYPLQWEDLVAFGDNYNDIEMLEAVGLGVAVGNAKDEVKEISNYVAAAGKEDGVAHTVRRLLDGEDPANWVD
ncbi:MAG TPA: Cof-type HAD-IIB family hydrolase [Bacteroidia bacterium]|jgi:Cof subfamily protein (haloacid dehalogenase superfamily)|nr:Cof-type HAD-IIB family hydrolase [Bacteroidia bacterium]